MSKFLSNSNQEIFLYQNQLISWNKFSSNVTSLAAKIKESKKEKWALYLEDSFLFAIGFFALLLAKKTIILPHNIQPKTLEMLGDIDILNEVNYDDNLVFLKDFEEIDENSSIIFFTSGSSGNPKEIHKKFSQLEIEVNEIAKIWPNHSQILVSTVSHQHIYGLLFRLLLPLHQKILINSIITLAPEELDSVAKKFSKITLISSPAFLKRLSEKTQFNTNFEYTFSSGGLLAKDDAEKSNEILNCPIIQILGSTETGGVAYRNHKNGETWTKFPLVEIKINNPDLLAVKSPYIGENDFIPMGDTAKIIDKTHFILKERSDRIIKIEEKRVSLNEIENRLRENNLVKNCHIIILDQNQKNRRQILAGLVELNFSGEDFLTKNGKLTLNLLLKKHLLQYFEPVVIPRKWRFVKQIPINSQGKLIAAEIKEMFR